MLLTFPTISKSAYLRPAGGNAAITIALPTIVFSENVTPSIGESLSAASTENPAVPTWFRVIVTFRAPEPAPFGSIPKALRPIRPKLLVSTSTFRPAVTAIPFRPAPVQLLSCM